MRTLSPAPIIREIFLHAHKTIIRDNQNHFYLITAHTPSPFPPLLGKPLSILPYPSYTLTPINSSSPPF